MRTSVDCLVLLPFTLLVERPAAGRSFTVKIADGPSRLSLPRLPKGDAVDDFQLLTEPSGRRLPKPTLTSLEARHGRWGYASGRPLQVFVETVKLTTDVDTAADMIPNKMRDLGADFNRWAGVAFDWLCAWSGQLRRTSLSLKESQLFTNIGGDSVYGSGVTLRAMAVFGQRPSTVGEVRAAFALASLPYELPLAYAMLSRARTEFAHGELRQSVIDACTAAEVALAEPVRRSLQAASGPSHTVEKVLANSGIVELFRLYLALGGNETMSEKRVMDRLAYPRNRATHAGSIPGRSEAQHAIEAAARLVSNAAPLMTPRQAQRTAGPSAP